MTFFRLRTSGGVYTPNVDPLVLVRNGVTSALNAEYVAFCISAYVALLADSPLQESHGQKPRRTFSKFVRYLSTTPIKDVIGFFSSLSDNLCKSCTNYGEGSTTGDFIQAMKGTPIFKEYLYWFRTGDEKVLQYILTFLTFLKKAEIQAEDLEPDALRKWFATEERLSTIEFPDDLIQKVRKLVHLLLPTLPSSLFRGRNGPGTVVGGGRAVSMKVNQIEYDPLVDRSFFLDTVVPTYQDRKGYDPFIAVPHYDKWIQARQDTRKPRRERLSELLLVPKDFKSVRTICRESSTFMYFQQALAAEMRESMENSPLSFFVDLESQDWNRQAAVLGSIDSSMDTIDLSSASDSISWELVQRTFPSHFLRQMHATRSNIVDVKGEHVRVRKFAPMGSAVCFPTQCVLYTAIVLSVYLDRTMPQWIESNISDAQFRKWKLRNTQEHSGDWNLNQLRSPRVYGDDIICDSKCTDDIIHRLSLLGFQVNRDKSFVSSQAFRESCGIYAWMGKDVTPLRLRTPFFRGRKDASSYVSVVELANNSGDYGYRNLQRFAILCALHWNTKYGVKRGGVNQVLFTEDRDQFGIFTKHARNSHLSKRQYMGQVDNSTCSHYQRDEVACIVIETRHDGLDKTAARQTFEYCAWWRTAYNRGDSQTEKSASLYSGVPVVRLTLGWTPE